MAFPDADMIVTLVLVAALVLVHKFRKPLQFVSRAGYADIAWGISILAVTSLFRLYRNTGVFAAVPFLSNAAFCDLVAWIGIISGMVLTVSGASSWLPIAKTQRRSVAQDISRSAFIRKVEQMAAMEAGIDRILASILRTMIDSFHFESGAVFTCSPRRRFLRPVAHSFDENEIRGRLEAVTFQSPATGTFASGGRDDVAATLTGLPEFMGPPDTILPVMRANRPIALFLLWADKNAPCDKEDLFNLKIAADIVARKIDVDCLRLKADFDGRRRKLAKKLSECVSPTADLNGRIKTLAEALSQEIAFSSLSVWSRAVSGERLNRVTIGRNRAVLAEKNLGWPGSDSVVGKVLVSGEALAIAGISNARRLRQDMTVPPNTASCVALPVTEEGRTAGVVMLTSGNTEIFSARDQRLLAVAVAVTARLIREEGFRLEREAREKRAARVNSFMGALTGLSSQSEACQAAARLLADEIRCSLVRISTVEDGGAFLKSEALATQRMMPGIIPSGGSLILSLMPRHQSAIDTGRPVLVAQGGSDESMPPAEASQALTEKLTSALIAPVVIGKRTVAVISLAEERNAKRFSFGQPDVLFAEMVGKCLGLALQRMTVHTALDIVSRRSKKRLTSSTMSAESLNRVKSPLTSLLGSVEVLRNRERRDDIAIDRYLEIIDRSAHKLGRFLEEQTPTVQ